MYLLVIWITNFVNFLTSFFNDLFLCVWGLCAFPSFFSYKYSASKHKKEYMWLSHRTSVSLPASWYRESSIKSTDSLESRGFSFLSLWTILDIPNKTLVSYEPLLVSSLSTHSTYLPRILKKRTLLCYYFVWKVLSTKRPSLPHSRLPSLRPDQKTWLQNSSCCVSVL